MQTGTYLYANNSPEERLKVRVIEDEDAASWVLVQPEGENSSALQIGLSPAQARDLAHNLFRTAAEAEATDSAIAARKAAPMVAP